MSLEIVDMLISYSNNTCHLCNRDSITACDECGRPVCKKHRVIHTDGYFPPIEESILCEDCDRIGF